MKYRLERKGHIHEIDVELTAQGLVLRGPDGSVQLLRVYDRPDGSQRAVTPWGEFELQSARRGAELWVDVAAAGVKRVALCHTPTPIWHNRALDALLGFELWVKRDDMTSGAAAGNKIRKLEYLLADALAHGATEVITCGGLQSNHARATALLARELGLNPRLFLRTKDASVVPKAVGDLLLDRPAGAATPLITHDTYRDRRQATP